MLLIAVTVGQFASHALRAVGLVRFAFRASGSYQPDKTYQLGTVCFAHFWKLSARASLWYTVLRVNSPKPVLNWASFCFANLAGSIRRTATKLYSGSKKLRSACSGNIRPIRRTLPLTGREQSFPVDEEEIKIKMMTVSLVFHSLRRECFYLLTCGRRSLVSWTQNEIVVSWITL